MFTKRSRAGERIRRVGTFGVHTKVSGWKESKDSKDSRYSHKGRGRERECGE